MVAVVFAIAQVDLKRSESVGEASAIGALRAISSAQANHAAAFGAYARSLRALSTSCPGVSTGFLSPDIGSDPAVKSGYEIRLYPATPLPGRDCHGEPTASGYHATAVPMQRSGGTARAFAVDENEVIWFTDTGVAPTPPFRETRTVRPLR